VDAWVWTVVAVVVVVGLSFAAWRLGPAKTRQHDRLAAHDPDAAARLEMQRAETNMRGRGAGGGFGGGGF
jgi:uncharacterized membrane-anchored protein YhcB (DUF1043 family)